MLLMDKIKIDIPPIFDATRCDYKDEELMKLCYNLSSKSYFKKISIDNFYSDSNLINYLDNYLFKNHIDPKKYDVYYRKGKEWYSTFTLYKKKKIFNK